MHISLHDLGKRYGYQWIIRNIELDIPSGHILGVKGHNGSGKSTLLNIISGLISASDGEIKYEWQGKNIDRGQIFQHLSYVAPYIQVVDHFTLREMYEHQAQFKPMRISNCDEFVALTQLGYQEGKYIKDYSSGMRQRVQLALGILADTPLLLLDEPTSYLDTSAKQWYHDLLAQHLGDRTIIIASNDDSDLVECQQIIDIAEIA